MVDVCVVTNIFRCNADLCESPRTQEGVFGESVISTGSVYTLPARISFFPMEAENICIGLHLLTFGYQSGAGRDSR